MGGGAESCRSVLLKAKWHRPVCLEREADREADTAAGRVIQPLRDSDPPLRFNKILGRTGGDGQQKFATPYHQITVFVDTDIHWPLDTLSSCVRTGMAANNRVMQQQERFGISCRWYHEECESYYGNQQFNE